MRALLAVIALIVLGALGTVGYLYYQEGGDGSFATVLNRIQAGLTETITAMSPKTERPEAAPTAAAPNAAAPKASASSASAPNTAANQDTDTGPLKFIMPARCTVGRDCLIQHFVDAEPGPDARDYKCGTLTTQGNQGTHIRLPGPQAMLKGVLVAAAATGEVLRVRDGLPDVDVTLIGRDALGSSGFGNVVLLKHRDGYLTAYGHLKRDSIRVTKGQKVRAGQILGEIGLSGATDFAHLHFEIRKDGKVVDPFTGLEAESGCGKTGDPLWTSTALERMAYFPSAVLKIGFSNVNLNQAALEYGLLAGDEGLGNKTTALIFHVYAAGLRAGDKAQFQIHGPTGEILTETEETVLEDSPTVIFRTGPPELGTALTPGSYRGSFTLLRDENGFMKTALTASTTVEIK